MELFFKPKPEPDLTYEKVCEDAKEYDEFLEQKIKLFVQKPREIVAAICRKCKFKAGSLPYPTKGDVHCPKCGTFLYKQL